MCLSNEWFSESEQRKSRLYAEGVSLEDVKISLGTYKSTIYPIAIEMAEYVFKDWTANRLALLDQESIKIILEIWDKHLFKPDIQDFKKVDGGYSFKGAFFKYEAKKYSDNPFSSDYYV